MLRIRQWAAVAAWLALSAAAAPACQLSLLGPVMQKPLKYNPFQAWPAAAEVSFTVRNENGKPCNAAFSFFRQGAPEARGGGGAPLTYKMLTESGPAMQGAAVPPGGLSGGGAAASITVGGKQSYTAQASLFVGDGQMVGPGTYTDQLTLGVYQSSGGGAYVKAAEAPFTATIGVNSQMTLAIAGGGRNTTLNFSQLAEGVKRSVQLLAYANQSFHLELVSENAGTMKPVDAPANSDQQARVPYTISIFGAGPMDLSQQRAVSLSPAMTQRIGLVIPIEVQIGSIKGKRAGLYRDVITVAADAGP